MDTIIENTSDSIWAVDKHYNVLYLNNSFRTDFKKVTGINLKQGDKILDLLPFELASTWKEKYDKALRGQSFTFEDSIIDKNENKLYIHVSLSPIKTKNTITGVTCFGRDITHYKLNEIALQKYSLLLESSLESQKDMF